MSIFVYGMLSNIDARRSVKPSATRAGGTPLRSLQQRGLPESV